MPPCEFNERQYEFCANFELQATMGAYLVGGMPAIPSQIDEAADGFDAAYAFAGGVTLFLQYKVSHYAPKAWGRGAETFKKWSQPYFRAPLHRDAYDVYTQHNALIALTSPSSEALYVAPCFHTKLDLKTHFGSGSGSGVLASSLLGPLSGLPFIADSDIHSITYPEDGSAFRVHSEPSSPVTSYESVGAVLDTLERRQWDEAYFEDVRSAMIAALEEHEVPAPEPPDGTEFTGPLDEIAAILDQRLGAVMALFPS